VSDVNAPLVCCSCQVPKVVRITSVLPTTLFIGSGTAVGPLCLCVRTMTFEQC